MSDVLYRKLSSMSGANGVWSRLEEKIPKAAVIQEIIADMDGIRPIRQKIESEIRAVLDRLRDFARRITEIGIRSESYSPNEESRHGATPKHCYNKEKENGWPRSQTG